MRQFVCNPIHCSNYCICYFIYYVLHYTVQCIVSFCNILLIHIKYFVAFIPQATQAGSGSVHITICTLLNDQKKKEKASFKKLHYFYYRWSQLQTDWWTDLCVCFLSATIFFRKTQCEQIVSCYLNSLYSSPNSDANWSTRGPVLTPLKHYFAIANILCIQSNFV